MRIAQKTLHYAIDEYRLYGGGVTMTMTTLCAGGDRETLVLFSAPIPAYQTLVHWFWNMAKWSPGDANEVLTVRPRT